VLLLHISRLSEFRFRGSQVAGFFPAKCCVCTTIPLPPSGPPLASPQMRFLQPAAMIVRGSLNAVSPIGVSSFALDRTVLFWCVPVFFGRRFFAVRPTKREGFFANHHETMTILGVPSFRSVIRTTLTLYRCWVRAKCVPLNRRNLSAIQHRPLRLFFADPPRRMEGVDLSLDSLPLFPFPIASAPASRTPIFLAPLSLCRGGLPRSMNPEGDVLL